MNDFDRVKEKPVFEEKAPEAVAGENLDVEIPLKRAGLAEEALEAHADKQRRDLLVDVEGERDRTVMDRLSDLYDRIRGKKSAKTESGRGAVEAPSGQEEKSWFSKAFAAVFGGASSVIGKVGGFFDKYTPDWLKKIFHFGEKKGRQLGENLGERLVSLVPNGLENFQDVELLDPSAPAFTFLKGATPRITSHFGFRNDPINKGKSQDHRGVDIGGLPVGTKIISTLNGCKVLASFFHAKAGNITKIQMPDGFVAVYMHLNKPGPKKGTILNKGDAFAEVGKTGSRVTGPHIHFEIRPGEDAKDWIDPASHLPAVLVAQGASKREKYYAENPNLKAKAEAKASQEALASHKEHFEDSELLDPNAPVFTFLNGTFAGLTSNFGWRYSSKTESGVWFHRGVDVAATMGSKIINTVGECRVMESGCQAGGYGNYVKIQMPNGKIALFGHLKELTYSVGTVIKRGEVIGLVGSTGNSEGPHIHFEIRPQVARGKWYDPTNYISDVWAATRGEVKAKHYAAHPQVPGIVRTQRIPEGILDYEGQSLA